METNSVVIRQNVGIDISKDTFDVCFVQMHQNFEIKIVARHKLANTPEGFTQLLNWVNPKVSKELDLSFTMEATGVYYEKLAYYLAEHSAKVHVVLPNVAYKYNQSMGQKSKTDKIDAYKLGCMGLERNLAVWKPISKNFRILRILTRERNALKAEKAMLKNQLHALKSAKEQVTTTLERYTNRLQYIEDQINEIKKEIETLVKEDKPMYQKVQNLLTIPGAGLQTIASVLAETNGFASITNAKQLTSYAGYDVSFRDSGQKIGIARISKKGNSHIRAVMFFPACAASKHNAPLKEDYQRLKDNNKPAMVANTAIQRKLICLMYALWKSNTTFDPEYEAKKQKHKQTKSVIV